VAKNNTITLYDLQLASGCTISPFVWATKYALKHKGFDIDVVPGGFTGGRVGSVVTTGGLVVLLLSLRASPSYVVIALGLLLSGLGTGIFLTANTTAIMSRAPADRLGIVNGVRLMVQNCGIVIGTALVLALITSPLDSSARGNVYAGDVAHLSARHTDQLVTGYRWALAVMVLAAIVGGFASHGDSDNRLRRLVRRHGPAVTPHAADAVTVTHVEGG